MPLMDKKTCGEREGKAKLGEDHRVAKRMDRHGGTQGAPAHLAKGPGGNHIVQELHGKPAAQLDGLYMALASPWEGGEEEAH